MKLVSVVFIVMFIGVNVLSLRMFDKSLEIGGKILYVKYISIVEVRMIKGKVFFIYWMWNVW